MSQGGPPHYRSIFRFLFSFNPTPTPSLFFFPCHRRCHHHHHHHHHHCHHNDDDDDDDDDVRTTFVKSAGHLKGWNDGMEYPRPQGVTGYSVTFPGVVKGW